MALVQKIIVCGNSAHITLPKPVLFFLGWLPGQHIVLEVTESKQLVVRAPAPEDFAPKRAGSSMFTVVEQATK